MHASLLEEIVKIAENTKHPSPFPVKDLPYFKGLHFNVGRAAVETLSEQAQIQLFMEQYVPYIQEQTNTGEAEALQHAREIVGYCTGYVSDEQANKWFAALPEIKHPIMGRKRPFATSNCDSYLITCSASSEGRRRLQDAFETLAGRYGADITVTATQDNVSYLLTPRKGSFLDRYPNTTMLLLGYVQGASGRIEEEIKEKVSFEFQPLLSSGRTTQ